MKTDGNRILVTGGRSGNGLAEAFRGFGLLDVQYFVSGDIH
jgi:short-subunit dehydrogenase involved in D-alanine esterification of teichoic acids